MGGFRRRRRLDRRGLGLRGRIQVRRWRRSVCPLLGTRRRRKGGQLLRCQRGQFRRRGCRRLLLGGTCRGRWLRERCAHRTTSSRSKGRPAQAQDHDQRADRRGSLPLPSAATARRLSALGALGSGGSQRRLRPCSKDDFQAGVAASREAAAASWARPKRVRRVRHEACRSSPPATPPCRWACRAAPPPGRAETVDV